MIAQQPVSSCLNHKKRLRISAVVYGGGHGTRISQEGASVEISRRKHVVHVCTRSCTQLPVYIPSASYFNNYYHDFSVIYLCDNPVITNSISSILAQSSRQTFSMLSGVICIEKFFSIHDLISFLVAGSSFLICLAALSSYLSSYIISRSKPHHDCKV